MIVNFLVIFIIGKFQSNKKCNLCISYNGGFIVRRDRSGCSRCRSRGWRIVHSWDGRKSVHRGLRAESPCPRRRADGIGLA